MAEKDVPNERQDEFDEKATRSLSLERMKNTIRNKINNENRSENIKLCDDVSFIPNKPEELEPISMEGTPDSKRFCNVDDGKNDKDNISEVLRSNMDEEDDEKIQTLELRETMKTHNREVEHNIMEVNLHKMMDSETNNMMVNALEEIKRDEALEKEKHEPTGMTRLKESRSSARWMMTDHEVMEEEQKHLKSEEHKEETGAEMRLPNCDPVDCSFDFYY